MEFITGKLPSGKEGQSDELIVYLMGLRDEINHALESVATSYGKRNGWTWRRNPDGTVECWRTLRCLDVCCSVSADAFFVSDKAYGEDIAYPFKFVGRPHQQISITSTDGTSYAMEYARLTDANIGKLWFCSRTQQTKSHRVELDVYIKGFIKGE